TTPAQMRQRAGLRSASWCLLCSDALRSVANLAPDRPPGKCRAPSLQSGPCLLPGPCNAEIARVGAAEAYARTAVGHADPRIGADGTGLARRSAVGDSGGGAAVGEADAGTGEGTARAILIRHILDGYAGILIWHVLDPGPAPGVRGRAGLRLHAGTGLHAAAGLYAASGLYAGASLGPARRGGSRTDRSPRIGVGAARRRGRGLTAAGRRQRTADRTRGARLGEQCRRADQGRS